MKNRLVSFLIFIEISLLIGAFIVFLISNKETLNFIIKKISNEYQISYESTSGSLLTGITLKNIKYKNEDLAKKIIIDWKITPLMYQRLSFKEIKIEDLKYPTLQKLLKKKSKKKSPSKNFKKLPLLKSIDIDKFNFSMKNFQNQNIKIKYLDIEADKIYTDFKDIKISNFKSKIDSDLAKVIIKGFWEDKNIYVNLLKAKNIDIDKIIAILKNKKQKKSSSNIILINGIVFNKIEADIKPFKYKQYKINSFNLNAENGFFDLKYLYLDDIRAKTDTNIADFIFKAKIDKNRLFAKSEIELKNDYLKKYSKTIDFSHIKPLNANFELGKDLFRATLFFKAKEFLKESLKPYQIEITDAKSVIFYHFKNKIFKSNTKANLKSKYFEKAFLSNHLDYNRSLSYKGEFSSQKFKNLSEFTQNILQNLKISYEGKRKNLKGKISSNLLKGNFDTKDFKILYLHLKSEYLKEIKAKAQVDSKIYLKNLKNSQISIKAENKDFLIKSALKLQKPIQIDSTIQPVNKKLKDLKIFPIYLKTTLKEGLVQSKIEGNKLKGELNYQISSKNIQSDIKLSTSIFSLKGDLDKNLSLSAKIASLRELKNDLLSKEKASKLKIDGELSINSEISLKNLLSKNQIKAKWLLYEYKENKFLVAEKLKSDISISKNKIAINNYSFKILNKKLFSSKESDIYLKDSKILVKSFFINDKGKIDGKYDTKTKKGLFTLKANRFHLKIPEGEGVFDTKISLKIDNDQKDIEGFIKLYKGIIRYEPVKTYKVQDKDIIILQQKPQKESKDFLSLNIRIFSVKPIIYKTKDIKASFNVDVTLWKEYEKRLELLGLVKLLNGEVKKEDKIFKIDSGEIMFGGDPRNPYLNIKLLHYVRPYEITIIVNGTLESPLIFFSSDPYLSQSDILSLILFGTTSNNLLSKSSSSSSKIISIFGNTLAKELADSLGIKLDRLSLMTKENGDIGIEVGKKISKKVTIFYRNDVVSTLTIQIEHSPKFETDITIKPNSSGIDFIYKKEY